MTDTSKASARVELSPLAQKFILHWGEMGTRWGISRTVAQIHALLYVRPEPLNAEQIAATLSVARSNVSTSIRELQGWGIISVVHRMGDRRDYFETMEDVWEMFRIVLEERKRREVDPTIGLLGECVSGLSKDKNVDNYERDRLLAMQDFFQTNAALYERIHNIPTKTLSSFARLGDKIARTITRAAGK